MNHELSSVLQILHSVSGHPVAPHVAALIGEFANGDPRIIGGVAKMLTPAQLRGAAALPDPLPTVESGRTDELDRLPVAERRMLLFTGLSVTRRIVDLLDSAAIEPDVLLFGDLHRYLSVSGGTVAFKHDRIRSQILADSDERERHAAHLALARVAGRRGDNLAEAWHRTQVEPATNTRSMRALLALANESLRRGEVRQAQAIARFAAETAPNELTPQAWMTAGLASFWSGELDDAKQYLERVVSAAGRKDAAPEAEAALFVRRSLVHSPGEIFSADETARIFGAMILAARNPVDREALKQLGAVADAVYGRSYEADSLQARLFLSLGNASGTERLSPHAEAHIIMMQVAFQSQSGDRVGAAHVLGEAVPRLPLALPAAGLVSSYVRIFAEFEPAFDSTLIAAYDAVGPARPLRYNGDGATIGHGPDVGARAAAAARMVTSADNVVVATTPLTVINAQLSPRERDVLALLIDGRSNRDISGALGISHRTVEVHVSNVLRKHEVRSRAELLSLIAGLRRQRTDTRPHA